MKPIVLVLASMLLITSAFGESEVRCDASVRSATVLTQNRRTANIVPTAEWSARCLFLFDSKLIMTHYEICHYGGMNIITDRNSKQNAMIGDTARPVVTKISWGGKKHV